jgi:GH35 family endo-1,4-beta-xylanase
MIAHILILSILVFAAAAFAAEPWDPEEVRKRITKHRTAGVTLSITDADGTPFANTDVTAEMVRHTFLFGCNLFKFGRCGSEKLNKLYTEWFSGLLNFATLPFYWGSYERKQGETNRRYIREAAEWCKSNGIQAKGHPLCWHTVEPEWIQAMDLEEVEKLQIGRIERDVTGFKGLINMWDVINEACIMPKYKYKGKTPKITQLCNRTGRIELIRKCFNQAVKADPEAILVLNDFNTGPEFVTLIGECIKAGVKIDAIGLQSHMHTKYRGAKWGWETCERFAKFKKPLHFTELTILSGDLKTDNDWLSSRPGWDTHEKGEKIQARQVAEIYSLLFSHPSVQAITWWDFSDLKAWQGAPAGLVRKDMTPKPAYRELMKLIKGTWWTRPQKLKTDTAGKVKLRGFCGIYRLTAGDSSGMFELKQGRTGVSVSILPVRAEID